MTQETWSFVMMTASACAAVAALGNAVQWLYLVKHIRNSRRAMTEAYSRDMQAARKIAKLEAQVADMNEHIRKAVEDHIGTRAYLIELGGRVADLTARCTDDSR